MKIRMLGRVLESSQCSKATRFGAYRRYNEIERREKRTHIAMQNTDVLISASHNCTAVFDEN